MKRPLKPDELRLWSAVAATVHPLPGRAAPKPPPEAKTPATPPAPAALSPLKPAKPAPQPALPTPRPDLHRPIEPRRKHRISKEREEIGARIDLHGLDQDRARAALESFLYRAQDQGFRAVLVITGKGTIGDGVLRRRTPEWLGAPHLHGVVAGLSEAHRRHGGSGALYVALKRKRRG